MIKKGEVGAKGEKIACEYLKRRGYKILEQNARVRRGEIDAVAKYRDGTLVIVEVKTMRINKSNALRPEDNLTRGKLKKLTRAALRYIATHEELVHQERGWRIDLVAVEIGKEGLTNNKNHCNIRHWKNITA